jgi:hypothetical protein
LLDERATYKNNDDFIATLDLTQKGIINDNENVIDANTLFNGTTKNILKDLASTRNYFWDFEENYAVLKSFSDVLNQSDVLFTFNNDIIKKPPQLTQNQNISAFNFTQKDVKIKTNEEYTLTTPTEIEENLGVSVNRYDLEDWGTVTAHEGGYDVPNTINKTVYTAGSTQSITVAPVQVVSTEIFVNNNKSGETFAENNACCFKDKFGKLISRMGLLNKYFNKNVFAMQFEGLPHFAIEPCDLVGVETNTVDNGVNIFKYGIVVEQELTYNGAWLQKMIVHEVNVDGGV